MLKGYKDEWINGSTNYCSSNTIDHATSEQHLTAMNKHMKAQGASFMEINQKRKFEGQQNIVNGLTNMSKTEEEMIRHRIEVP